MFRIHVFSQDADYSNNILCYEGEITVNNYTKKMSIPVAYWTLSEYKKQWFNGIERIKTHDTSCLVFAAEDENTGPVVYWFLLYKKNGKILMQIHLFVDESYEEYIGNNLITLENCYDFIPAYHTHYKDHEMVVFDADELEENINVQITVRKPKVIHEMMSVQGVMQLGTIKEKLILPAKHWSAADYERQWQEGIARIKKNDKSCIVTRVFPTRTIDWYVLYKKDGKVYAYRYFLVAEDYDEVIGNREFTPDNCYDFIPSFDEYQKIHAQQFKIEEWEIDLQDIYDVQIIVPE